MDLTLIWSVFRRHKARTIFTILSVATAFAIFTVLAAIEEGMSGNLSLASAQRLDTSTTINAPLPISYAAVIRSVPGVVAIAYESGFGGYFRDPKQQVGVWATSLPSVFRIYPDFVVPDDQKQAVLTDRQGAVVGEALAQKMGWHIGQTVPIQGGPQQKSGSTTWFFHIDGIYHNDLSAGNQDGFLVNYDYFNEGLAPSPIKDTTPGFSVLVDSPKDMDRVARAIDARFTNASSDTTTQSEAQESMSWMRQFGDVGTIITSVGLAVFASMLLITGNTMANSVRERMGEFAMMRALGFRRRQLALAVLRESATLIGTGAALGLLVGWGVSRLMAPAMTTVLTSFAVTWLTILLAATLALLFALATGLFPGRRVTAMPIAATLRRM